MSVTSTEKKENNIVELEIAVGADELKAATDRVYRRKAKTITVPGFRKGKAPRSVIEKMYGEGVFLEDAVDDLYPGAYEAAIEETGIEPVDRASVEMLTLDKETGFTFKATVTVKPEITLGDYKGLAAERVVRAVTDEELAEELDRLRDRNARVLTVEEAAQDGDIAVIDFEGFLEDVPFEGGKGEGHELTLGSGQFIPGFEEQVVGKKAGEEFDVNVTFPQEYHAEDLQGKAVVFKVKLSEVKRKELPELDDELAKDLSEFDTLEEMKQDMRASKQKFYDNQAKEQLESDLMDKVVESFQGDVPTCMFERKQDELIRDFEYRLSYQGLGLEQYIQFTGMDMEAFRGTFREQAERQVRIRLAMEKIAALEQVTVPEEEYQAELEKISENYNVKPDQVEKMIPRKEIEADIKCTKALDLVLEAAKVTEVKAEDKEKEEAKKAEAAAKDEKKAEPKRAKTVKKDENKKEKASEKEEKKETKKKAVKKPADPDAETK